MHAHPALKGRDPINPTYVPLLIGHAVSVQEAPQLLLKRYAPVMLLLAGDVTDERGDL
jgi:hypothetical protein